MLDNANHLRLLSFRLNGTSADTLCEGRFAPTPTLKYGQPVHTFPPLRRMHSVPGASSSSIIFDCAYLNLCLIDAEAHHCCFPLMLETLRTQQAQISNKENALFLVNYSMAPQEVREALTSLFAAAFRGGALAGLEVMNHQEVVHQSDNSCFASLPMAPGDGGLGSFQAYYRGPNLGAQCIQLSLHRPLKLEGLRFGALYCLLQVEFTIAPNRYRNVTLLWCPCITIQPHQQFPEPLKKTLRSTWSITRFVGSSIIRASPAAD